MNHPYQQQESHPAWAVLNRALDDLVRNGDLDEKTARAYITGYLVKVLSDHRLLQDDSDRNDRKTVLYKVHAGTTNGKSRRVKAVG